MATFKSGKRGRPLELDIESTYFRFWDLTPLASIRLGKLRQETKGIRGEAVFGSQTSLPDWLDESLDLLSEARQGRDLSYKEAKQIKQNLESLKELTSPQRRVYERALSEQLTMSYYDELTSFEKKAKSKFTKQQISDIKTKVSSMTKRERQKLLTSKKYQSPKATGRYKRVRAWAEKDSGRKNMTYEEAWAYLQKQKIGENDEE